MPACCLAAPRGRRPPRRPPAARSRAHTSSHAVSGRFACAAERLPVDVCVVTRGRGADDAHLAPRRCILSAATHAQPAPSTATGAGFLRCARHFPRAAAAAATPATMGVISLMGRPTFFPAPPPYHPPHHPPHRPRRKPQALAGLRQDPRPRGASRGHAHLPLRHGGHARPELRRPGQGARDGVHP